MKKLLISILIINLYATANSQEKKLTAGLSVGSFFGISYSIYIPVYYKLNEKFIVESGLSNTLVRNKLEYSSFQYNGSEAVEKTNKKIILFYIPGIPVAISFKVKNFYFGSGVWVNNKFSETVIYKGTDYKYLIKHNKIYTNLFLKAGWQHKLTNKTIFFTEVTTIPILRGHTPAVALVLFVGIKLNNKVLNN